MVEHERNSVHESSDNPEIGDHLLEILAAEQRFEELEKQYIELDALYAYGEISPEDYKRRGEEIAQLQDFAITAKSTAMDSINPPRKGGMKRKIGRFFLGR